jgi:NADH:ubiquinone oxidoreductase subunit 3 (subunit A)
VIQVYNDNFLILSYTCLAILSLCWFMLYLNKIYSNFSFVSRKYKRGLKRSNTYEFETSGLRYDVSVRSMTKPFLLALLFLLFNVKVSFLVILVINFKRSIISMQAVGVWYILFLLIGIWVEIYCNSINFYPFKKENNLI